jgi:DNA replication protein
MIPVPSPLLGSLLEEIDDLAELKATLRVIWLLYQKKGYPRFITLKELLADPTLVKALAAAGPDPRRQIERALERAVQRGTLICNTLQQNATSEQLYALNTEQDRKALAGIAGGSVAVGPMPKARPWEASGERPNIFALYEDNIGILSPMIAEELREAEQQYPAEWIEDAFREAVEQNKRSWRYIARILERWEREGRSDGRPERYPKKAGYHQAGIRGRGPGIREW